MARPVVDPDAVRRVAVRLEAAGVPNPVVDARLLLEHVVEVAGSAAGCGGALLDGLVQRRAARVPLQQVIGRAWFRTLELTCAPGVFVPRPETEIVAGAAVDAARAADRRHARVVDVGTGTGAIACSVAAEVPGADVIAVDWDPLAVALAGVNAERLADGTAVTGGPAPGATLRVLAGSLLDPVPDEWLGEVDVLVSNPPYLPASDRGSWAPEVAQHDPDHALVGGDDGHEVVDALLDLAGRWLRPGGTVVIEIDDRRGADAVTAARAAGLDEVRLLPDLTRRDRAVVGTRAR
jgi:release factor glutamine methyltransferase